MDIIRTCTTCNTQKPIADFKSDPTCTHGKRHICRDCYRAQARNKHNEMKTDPVYRQKLIKARRKYQLKSGYGISPEGYAVLHKEQGGACLICKEVDTGRRKLSVDHCHKTGNIRGLLCGGCNLGLGNFLDSPELLEAGAEYLRTR